MTADDQNDPDKALERTGDELEERVNRLGEHLDEAQKRATERAEEDTGAVAEDPQGEAQDHSDQAG